jgi:hypothetical protein
MLTQSTAPVTITPKELGIILDLAANAPAKIGDGFRIAELLQRAVVLANADGDIGVLKRAKVVDFPNPPATANG